MDPLVRYYLRQAGRGHTKGIRPIYDAPPVLQRGYGIGSFLQDYGVRLDRSSGAVPKLWDERRYARDAISCRAWPDRQESPKDIVSRRVNETAENLIGKLRGRGRKRKANKVVKREKNNGAKKKKITKTDIFS